MLLALLQWKVRNTFFDYIYTVSLTIKTNLKNKVKKLLFIWRKYFCPQGIKY